MIRLGNVHYLSAQQCRVRHCGRVTDLYACWQCMENLGVDLDDVPDLVTELDLTLSRQARLGTTTPAMGAEHPLPYQPDAADALWVLANVLGTWAIHLATDRGVAFGASALPGHPGPLRIVALVAARWLAARLPLLRRCPEVGDAHDELRDAIRAARRVINRNPALAYAGTCPQCSTPERPAHLYAGANDQGEPIGESVTCRLCETRWSYLDTRAAMEKLALDHLATAAEIARAMPVLYGTEITVTRIRKWAQRGHLKALDTSRSGHPMYRLGDVRDLAQRMDLTWTGNRCHARPQADHE